MNKRAGLTAADIVNTYDEERLADIFYLYGELKNSRKLASVIVKARAPERLAPSESSWILSNRSSDVKEKRKNLQKCFRRCASKSIRKWKR